MKIINAVTIGKLIEAHMEHDEEKFLSYVNFIAEAYEEEGEERKARIIRSKLDGSYKKISKVTLDDDSLISKLLNNAWGSDRKYFYLKSTGERYMGPVYLHGCDFPLTDGRGNIIEYR